MSTLFTRIINREIPSYIVAEDEYNIAFLDIEPLVKGHTLVVPKKEVDYFLNLSEDLYIKFNLFARKVAQAIQKKISCLRIGTAIVGLEVPHLHLHLVPLNKMNDLNFSNPRLNLVKTEFQTIATSINHAYREIEK